MAKQAVATRPSSRTPTAPTRDQSDVAPSFMQDDIGKGAEGLGQEDLELPRIKLIQGVSPELQEFDDLRAGSFLHTANEHIFSGSFKAVPIYVDRRYMLWNPREAGGGILARADDGVHWSPANREFTVKLDRKDGGATVKWKTAKTVQESGLANWGTMDPNNPDSAPAATLMYNYLLGFPENPELMPAVMTFQRTSIAAGRKFNTKLKTVRAPIYGTLWEFSSYVDSRNGQDFHNIRVSGAGFLTDKGLYDEYKHLNESYISRGMTIKDLETVGDEDPVGDEEPEEVPSKGSKKPRY